MGRVSRNPKHIASQGGDIRMGEPEARPVCRECKCCALPCKQLEPVEVAFCRLFRSSGGESPSESNGHGQTRRLEQK